MWITRTAPRERRLDLRQVTWERHERVIRQEDLPGAQRLDARDALHERIARAHARRAVRSGMERAVRAAAVANLVLDADCARRAARQHVELQRRVAQPDRLAVNDDEV